MTPTKKLTPKEAAFVRAYAGEAAGNGAKAAVLAGYAKNSAHVTGSRLLRKANIATALAKVVDAQTQSAVADAAERRELLTGMARSKDEHPVARLKAVDILNKMDGLYVQKHEVSGRLTLEQVLDASRGDGAAA